MPKKPLQIYQFKITLDGIKPAIWRRIQVIDTSTFKDLHDAIQRAMGWENCHLHQFIVINPKTDEEETIAPSDHESFEPIVNENKKQISSYFSMDTKRALYEYDFGDGWEHKILLEKILPIEAGKKYPLCISGERACPPEDSGGVWEYQHLLEIIKNPNHPEYEERIEWLGESFNPEAFKAEDVDFEP